MNGNYFPRTYAKTYPGNPLTDTLQPYLVSKTTGLLTTINVVNARTNLAISGITIKVYKYIGGLGRTFVEQLVSDSKGQAISLLVLGGEYEFEVYNGSTFIKTYNFTATSNTIVIAIDLGETLTPPLVTGYSVRFTPTNTGLTKLNVGNQVFTQTVFDLDLVSTTYVSSIIQNGVILSTQTVLSSDANKTFTHSVAWTEINKGTVTSKLTITVGGVTYIKQQDYIINDSFGSNYNIFEGLSSGLRSDFSCDASGICYPLFIIALLITIGVSLYASMLMGQFGTQTTAIIAGILIVFFTYVTWIPMVLTVGMVLIGLAWILNERRN